MNESIMGLERHKVNYDHIFSFEWAKDLK